MTDLDRLTQQIQLAAASIPYGGDEAEIDSALGQLRLLIDEAREHIDGVWFDRRSALSFTASHASPKFGTADLLKDLGL